MALFRRRPRQLPATEPVAVAVAPVTTGPMPGGPRGLTAGWGGMGVLSASDQIGRFAGTQLTQVGGYITEVQRFQGVEGISAGWIVPPQIGAALGYSMTLHTGNPAEAQRMRGGNDGGLGPITARAMRANVTAQQIRQSGLAAVQWAQALTPTA